MQQSTHKKACFLILTFVKTQYNELFVWKLGNIGYFKYFLLDF